MFKAIVLDDEQPSLERMGKILGSLPSIDVCGLFSDADSLLSALKKKRQTWYFWILKYLEFPEWS